MFYKILLSDNPTVTHIILLLRLPVEEDDLAVVPAPVLLLDVGQVEAGGPQPLPVAGLHLGDPAVVGLGVEEVVGAVCGVVVVPGEERKMLDYQLYWPDPSRV